MNENPVHRDMQTLTEMMGRWNVTHRVMTSNLQQASVITERGYGALNSIAALLLHLESARASLAYIDYEAGEDIRRKIMS